MKLDCEKEKNSGCVCDKKMEKVVTLEKLQSMTWDELWALIDSNAVVSRPNIETCKPNYIGPLYCNTQMPHYSEKDGTSITLDTDNVFNGTLKDKDKTDEVGMNWKGYSCQLYDGTLKLGAISQKASVIWGTCNGKNFMFEGTTLAFGCWPGFLELYGR